jgi:hypothetical protein
MFVSPAPIRWILVLLLLPALAAPRGAAWAWCLCADVLCGCCVAGWTDAEACCPDTEEDGDPEDCDDCGRVQVDSLEPLVVLSGIELAPLLSAWESEVAVGAPDSLHVRRCWPRGPPAVDAGPVRGTLPLRI